MCERPETPSARNQSAVTGPKTLATLPVPKRWTANSTARMTSVIGTTYGSKAGVTTFRPSTADSTEIAGVMMASPKNSAAPQMPMTRIAAAGASDRLLRASAISDSVPPSPLLSARSTKTTYLIVTMTVSAQTISDSTPSTSSRDGRLAAGRRRAAPRGTRRSGWCRCRRRRRRARRASTARSWSGRPSVPSGRSLQRRYRLVFGPSTLLRQSARGSTRTACLWQMLQCNSFVSADTRNSRTRDATSRRP